MRGPRTDSSAGSRVSAASTETSTTRPPPSTDRSQCHGVKDEQAGKADHHRDAGKEHRTPRLANCAGHSILNWANLDLFAEPADHKQGIIDAHPQTDHRRHIQAEDGKVRQVSKPIEDSQGSDDRNGAGDNRHTGGNEGAKDQGQEHQGNGET